MLSNPKKFCSRLICAAATSATFLALTGCSAPDRASVLVGSKHVGAPGQFNESNPGLFLTWEGKTDLSVGTYHNSYGQQSTAVTAALPGIKSGDFEAQPLVGIAHYPGSGHHMPLAFGDMVPMAGAQIRYGNLFAHIFPMNGKPVDAVLAFGVTFPLGDK